MNNNVQASPSKHFFVSMLTRDIDLKDSILDLLDNCVDGILRQLKNSDVQDTEEPYLSYWARIIITPEEFSITDNCGGISKETALNSAFRLGRKDDAQDKDIATVGMYGIGMKRAMFKMGEYSKVISFEANDSYYVEITPEWLKNDDLWTLDLIDAEADLEEHGTKILVKQLYENIKDQFDSTKSNFIDDLIDEISNFYALILKKGFKVYVNSKEIEAKPLDILFPNNFDSGTITPYLYVGDTDNVSIKIMVGFYRQLASEIEIEDEKQIPRSRDNAGWTIICNDRVILYRDKTQITGWGDGDVPKYHNQFIAIAGVVIFYSNEPLKLPINTTKRGIDMQTPVYWQARKYMKQGLKKFTDFTNYWKGQEEETKPKFTNTNPSSVNKAIASIPNDMWKQVRGETSSKYFVPELPRPSTENVRRRISFLRTLEDVELLGEFYFDNQRAEPSEIGARCFDEAIKKAQEN